MAEARCKVIDPKLSGTMTLEASGKEVRDDEEIS